MGFFGLFRAAPAEAADPILVGAGDIASCNENGDEITARMLDGRPGTVFTLGDNAYNSGTAAEYRDCYDPTWGRHKARTRPIPGKHEYGTPGASGYFGYFGAAAGPSGLGYYSYDLGAWHVIALNSNLPAGPGSTQHDWLLDDLAAHPSQNACTVAMWHHPVFSSGEHGNDGRMAPAWKALDEAGAELALVGHDHDYERFAPQTSTGTTDPNGLTQIVVGTGGRHLRPFAASIRPNSAVRNSNTLGLFEMTLRSGALDYRFIPEPGKTFTDSGTISCDAPPTDAMPPETTFTSGPTGTTTTSSATFAFASDDGAAAFECSLDGLAFVTCASQGLRRDSGRDARLPGSSRRPGGQQGRKPREPLVDRDDTPTLHASRASRAAARLHHRRQSCGGDDLRHEIAGRDLRPRRQRHHQGRRGQRHRQGRVRERPDLGRLRLGQTLRRGRHGHTQRPGWGKGQRSRRRRDRQGRLHHERWG